MILIFESSTTDRVSQILRRSKAKGGEKVMLTVTHHPRSLSKDIKMGGYNSRIDVWTTGGWKFFCQYNLSDEEISSHVTAKTELLNRLKAIAEEI